MNLKKEAGRRRTAAINEWRDILPTWYAWMQPRWELYKMATLMRDAGFDSEVVARTLRISQTYAAELLNSDPPPCPAELLRRHRQARMNDALRAAKV